MPAGGTSYFGSQAFCPHAVKIELHDGSGDVPRQVLTPDEIVRVVMIKRIRLEQASVLEAEPFVPIQTAVEIDGVYPTIQASELSSSEEPTVPVLLATGRSPSSDRRE